MDTSGSFTLAIKLPSKDYQPRPSSKKDRRYILEYHKHYYRNQRKEDAKRLKEGENMHQ